MDGKLCPGIQPPPLSNLHPIFQGKSPPLIQNIFKSPFLKFWLESQTLLFRKAGECPLCGKELSLLMGVHSEARYFLKWLAFNLKSLSNLFPMNTGGIKGISLLLQNVFGMEQYVLELVHRLNNILVKYHSNFF